MLEDDIEGNEFKLNKYNVMDGSRGVREGRIVTRCGGNLKAYVTRIFWGRDEKSEED